MRNICTDEGVDRIVYVTVDDEKAGKTRNSMTKFKTQRAPTREPNSAVLPEN